MKGITIYLWGTERERERERDECPWLDVTVTGNLMEL